MGTETASTSTTSMSFISISNTKRVIEGLVHGQECAAQLQILFHKEQVVVKDEEEEEEEEERGRFGRASAEKLLQKILRSFDEGIALLSTTADSCYDSPADAAATGCCTDDRKSQDSSESRKRPDSNSNSKDKRGCYKRKRSAETWTVVSATMEDGHAWRKYGQKAILNSTHPRSYFRCTRKYEQGCKATKQVQRMEDDSQMYETTYIGNHTCRDNSLKPPQIISTNHHHQIVMSTKIPSIIKQESKELESAAATPSDVTDNLDTMIIWKDIVGTTTTTTITGASAADGFEYSSHSHSATAMGSDYGYSFPEITSQLDFDTIKPFETDFHFDESEFVLS